MNQSTENELIRRAKDGDWAAFEEIMQACQDNVYRLAYRLCGSQEAADTVTQDVFVQSYKSLGEFKGKSRLMTWLYRMTVNKAADHQRWEKRIVPGGNFTNDYAGMPARTVSPEDELDNKELMEHLSDAIMQLPPEQRTALVLVAQEGLSYSDAAEALMCSRGTVAWRVHMARQRLRRLLNHHLNP